MKKSLVLAAIASALVAPCAAMALDTNVARVLRVPGFPAWRDNLGTAMFIALGRGRASPFCDYAMLWESPFNPNDVVQCDLREYRTVASPSCIQNERHDIVTSVLAGPLAGTYCAGFNVTGQDFDEIALVLGESHWGLNGAVILPTAIPVIYPVFTETL